MYLAQNTIKLRKLFLLSLLEMGQPFANIKEVL